MNLLSYHASGLLALVSEDPNENHDPLRVDFWGVPDPLAVQNIQMPARAVYALADKPVPTHDASFEIQPGRRWLSSHEHLERFVNEASAHGLDVAYLDEWTFDEQTRTDALGEYQRLLADSGADVNEQDIMNALELVGGQYPYHSFAHHLSEEFLTLTDTLHRIYEHDQPARRREVELLAEYAVNPDLGIASLQDGLEARLRIGVDQDLGRRIVQERSRTQEYRQEPSMRTQDNYVIGKELVRKQLHKRINEQYFPEL